MDKLKTALDAAKKYNFWVLTVVLLLAALGSWFGATADIFKQVDAREGKINSHISALEVILIKPDLPNEHRIESIDLKHEQLTEKVYEAWKWLKQEQANRNTLSKKLSEDFRRAFAESVELGTEIGYEYREHYYFFIRDHFPELFKVIGIRQPVEGESEAGSAVGAGGSGDRGVAAEGVRMTGIVDWDDSDRQRVVNRFSWETVPRTAEVLLAQEDLWVYEALLRTIKKTNGNITEQYNAPIQRINALEIGREASRSCLESGQIIMAIETGAPQATSGADRGDYGEGFDDSSAEGGFRDHFEGLSDPTLLEQRYVGLKGRPLGAKEPHPYAEFKMMPIRMSLFMDQMAIPKLLVACANSNMPIEILKVRLRPGEAHDLGLTPRVETEGELDRAMHGGGRGEYIGTAHRGGFDGGGFDGGGRALETSKQPLYMPVELQGIIYIFNPPDKKKQGTGTATEDQPQPPVDTPPGVTPPKGETPPTDTVTSDNSATNP